MLTSILLIFFLIILINIFNVFGLNTDYFSIWFTNPYNNEKYKLIYFKQYKHPIGAQKEQNEIKRMMKDELLHESIRFINIKDQLKLIPNILGEWNDQWCIKTFDNIQTSNIMDSDAFLQGRINVYDNQDNICTDLSLDANTQAIKSDIQENEVDDIFRLHYGKLWKPYHCGLSKEIGCNCNNDILYPPHINQAWFIKEKKDINIPERGIRNIAIKNLIWQDESGETRIIGNTPLNNGDNWLLVPGGLSERYINKINDNNIDIRYPILLDTKRIKTTIPTLNNMTHLEYVQKNGYENLIRQIRLNAQRIHHDAATDTSTMNAVLEDDDCVICFEKLCDNDRLCALKCSDKHHIFHQDCLSKWYYSNNNNAKKCPNCRTDIDQDDLRTRIKLSSYRVPPSDPNNQEAFHGVPQLDDDSSTDAHAHVTGTGSTHATGSSSSTRGRSRTRYTDPSGDFNRGSQQQRQQQQQQQPEEEEEEEEQPTYRPTYIPTYRPTFRPTYRPTYDSYSNSGWGGWGYRGQPPRRSCSPGCCCLGCKMSSGY